MSLRAMFRSLFESQLGRIRWRSNMWAVIGSRWDKNRVVNRNIVGRKEINVDGEWECDGRTLVRRLCTQCPMPPGTDFAAGDNGSSWVPATECRKCQYYRKAQRGRRFSVCAYRAKSPKEAVLDIADMVNEAAEDARRIVRGDA